MQTTLILVLGASLGFGFWRLGFFHGAPPEELRLGVLASLR